MGTFNQCTLYLVAMATSTLFCSVLVLITMVASSLESPTKRSDILTAGSLKWKESSDVIDYPEEAGKMHIAQLEKQNKMHFFLTSDKIKKLSKRIIQDEQNNTKNLCSSVKRNRVPKSVEIDGYEYYVLNPEARLIQYFETEECDTNVVNTPCKFVETENTYSTICKQEFITRELYLMNKTNPYEALLVEQLHIESCCSCFVTTY